jgi:hypothetical protein
MSEILAKGASLAGAEIRVIRGAVSDIAASAPADMPAKIITLVKDIWAAISESRIIALIVAKLKELLGQVRTATTRDEVLPLLVSAREAAKMTLASASSAVRTSIPVASSVSVASIVPDSASAPAVAAQTVLADDAIASVPADQPKPPSSAL